MSVKLPLLPGRATLLLFGAATLLWLPILADSFDRLPDPWDTVSTVADVLVILTLGGMYSAHQAFGRPERRGDRLFLALLGVRSGLLIGLAAALASALSG